MSDNKSKASPIVAIAAISVIIFSAVGVGVMTGIIPSSFSKNAPIAEQAPPPPVAALTQPSKPAAAAIPPSKTAAVQAPAPAARKPARAESSRPEAREQVRTAAERICAHCGTVNAVDIVEKAGEGTGLGVVAGGVVGGVLGNQIGGGSGRRIATVAGAAGGAYAGHQIEKHVKTARQWNVIVRMDDGTTRTFPFESEPGFRAGDKVRIADGQIVAR
jgi:outer membrane lipoprotein SlyB